MKRVLICLLVFLCPAIQAAVNVDALIDWDQVSRGTVDTTALAATRVGYISTWHNDTITRFSIVSGDSSFAFPVPITISNVSYSGSATNWLRNNTGAGTGTEQIYIRLAGGNEEKENTLVGGFVRFNTRNTNASDMRLDLMIIYTAYGSAWSLMQLQMASGYTNIASHAQTNGVSTFGNPLSLVQNKVYYHMLLRDSINGVSKYRLYDPANNFALVGESICSMGVSNNSYMLNFYSGYIGDPPGNVDFGPQFIKYNPTQAEMDGLVTNAPVAITAQPQSLTNVTGTTQTFSVTAQGAPTLVYQWYKTNAITDETNSTYSISNCVPTNSGSYFVVVTNTYRAVTSSVVTLTITNAPVSIWRQPSNLIVLAGLPATFRLYAIGSEPITYQWYKNGTLINGATSSIYTIAATVPADSGTYTCAVSNPENTVTSVNGLLTVARTEPIPFFWRN